MKKIIPIIITIILLITVAFAVDTSGANAPEVYQGLYPIKYVGGVAKLTSASDPDWYNYTEGKWANAVTLDKLGQMNPAIATEANITGYYVWIPRYAYLIRTGYGTSDEGRIDIRFLSGASNKDKNEKEYFTVDDLNNTSEKWEEVNTVTYVGDRQMAYLVHPAFKFEEELTGIWVGKSEVNKGVEQAIELVNTMPNEALWTSIDINTASEESRNMVSKSEKYDIYNLYGLGEEVNTHLIKTKEYGAVVYLDNSIYGDNAETEIYRVEGLNENKEYTAGGLKGATNLVDKYIDIYEKDAEGKIINEKGSAYLETSDGTEAWQNQTTVGNGLDHSAGIIIKENEYGSIASSGGETDTGFRVVLTKGSNRNAVKEAVKQGNSYWWLMENGDVWVMGDNTYGQLGLGDNNSRVIPQKIEIDNEGNKFDRIKKIIVKTNESYYLSESGKVYVAGKNTYGKFGLGNTDNINMVTLIPGISNIKIENIIIGQYNAYYIGQEKGVWVAGTNTSGVLGLGNTDNVATITEISTFAEIKIKDIIVNEITDYDDMWEDKASAYYLSEEGDAYSSGDNSYGQLGIGNYNDVNVPTKINFDENIKIKKIASTMKSLDVGSGVYAVVYFIGEDKGVYVAGTVQSSGVGYYGEKTSPIKVNEFNDEKIENVEIVILDNWINNFMNCSTYYITYKGEVYVTGDNEYAQLGLGNFTSISNIQKNTYLSEAGIKEIAVTFNNETIEFEEGSLYSGDKISFVTNNDEEYIVGYISEDMEREKIPVERIEKKDFYGFAMVDYIVIPTMTGKKVSNNSIVEPSMINDVTNDIVISYSDSTLYLTEGGDVYVCGYNNKGHLGTGGIGVNITKVELLKKLKDVAIKKVTTDGIRTNFLTEDGVVYIAGNNNSNVNISSYIGDIKIKDIVSDSENTWYLSEDGKVYVTGKNNYGQLGYGNESEVTAIVRLDTDSEGNPIKAIDKIITNGSDTWYITKEGGEVYVSGRNNYGQLGVGDKSIKNKIEKIKKDSNNNDVKDISNIIAITNGAYYITKEGQVYVSGRNNNGQLGAGDATEVLKIQKIEKDNENKTLPLISEIFASGWTTYYITQDRKLYVSGRNNYGQLGDGSLTTITVPQRLEADNNGMPLPAIRKIVCSYNSTYYMGEDKTLYVSGRNNNGQLGIGEVDKAQSIQKLDILNDNNENIEIEDIVITGTSNNKVIFLSTEGEVFVSGKNTNSELGIEETQVYNVKQVIKDNNNNNLPFIEKVIANTYRTWLISKNGSVFVSGKNDKGQLGIGTTSTVSRFTKLMLPNENKAYATLSNITSIYGNTTSTVFEQDNGDIYVIGDNTNNKLGVTGNIDIATKIDLKNIKDVGIGNDFSVFLKDDGSIVGYGNSSKNGNGLTNIAQIAVGDNHAVFLTKSGEIINRGTTTSAYVTGVNNAYKIVAGANHTVVLKKDGTTQTFGQADPRLTNIVDVFAGKDLTIYLLKDGTVLMMQHDCLAPLTALTEIVYTELNGEIPYFINYDRELLDMDGNKIKALGIQLTWVREVKGDVVLTERERVYDLSKL